MTYTKYIGEMQREWDRDTTRKTVMIEIDCEDIDLSRSRLRGPDSSAIASCPTFQRKLSA